MVLRPARARPHQPDGRTDQELPDEWFCEMNMDNIYKSCDVEEQDWLEEEEEEEECSG